MSTIAQTPKAYFKDNKHSAGTWNTDFDNGRDAWKWYLAQLQEQAKSDNNPVIKKKIALTMDIVASGAAHNGSFDSDGPHKDKLQNAGAMGKQLGGGGWHDSTIDINGDDKAKQLYDYLDNLLGVSPDSGKQEAAAQKTQESMLKAAEDHGLAEKQARAAALKLENDIKEQELRKKQLEKEMNAPRDEVKVSPEVGGAGAYSNYLNRILGGAGTSFGSSSFGRSYGSIIPGFEKALAGSFTGGNESVASLII